MSHQDDVADFGDDFTIGNIAGRLGDVSGRLGDVSGRLGDVSGRLGDVSGRLGDVSGSAPLEVVQESLLLDRQADKVKCTESRISRLESETLMIVRWVNAQILLRESSLSRDVRDSLSNLENKITALNKRLRAVEDRLNNPGPKPPTP